MSMVNQIGFEVKSFIGKQTEVVEQVGDPCFQFDIKNITAIPQFGTVCPVIVLKQMIDHLKNIFLKDTQLCKFYKYLYGSSNLSKNQSEN